MKNTYKPELLTAKIPQNRIVFIDPTVEDYQSLVKGVLPNTEVVILDADGDGVEQINAVLATKTGVTSLHIVSHGAPGLVYLGTAELGQHTLNSYAGQLINWAEALSTDAQILLYGCDVAQTPLGKAFVHRLSELTGATVLASDNRTGSAALGGDWELKVTTANSTAELAFESATLEMYGAVLAQPYLLQPYLLKDINNGFSSASPKELINFNGTLYFVADDGIHGPELWQSDGTDIGTVLVKDIYTGNIQYNEYSGPTYLTNVNGTLYFAADNGLGYGLWKSDGTAFGISEVENFGYYSQFGRSVGKLTNVNGTLYFGVQNFRKRASLWISNGTQEGTIFIKEFGPNPDDEFYDSLRFLPSSVSPNGILYFQVLKTSILELWKSDGTEEGTVEITDVDSFPLELLSVNDTIYFVTSEGIDSYKLWKSDSTLEDAVLLKNFYSVPTYNQYYDRKPNEKFTSNLTNVNGIVYFVADDGTNGIELWKSDGTPDGTVLVKDINPGSGSSSVKRESFSDLPSNRTDVNGTLYFVANDGVHGAELWKSDGTEAGTVLVKDINPGSGSSAPSELTNVDGILYFVATNSINGRELWKSDGTEAGTVLVKDINPGSSDSNTSELTYINGTLYFSADDGIRGQELWALNITPAVASPIVSLNVIDAEASEIGNNPAVFRISRTGDTSTDLSVKYIISGTANNGSDYDQLSGTATIAAGESFVDLTVTPVNDIYREGTETVNVTLFTLSNYALDTSNRSATVTIADNASTAVVGQPYLVKDINPGGGSSFPYNLININDTLYFTTDDGIQGYVSWKSDGTEEGTIQVEDIGSVDFDSSEMIDINGILYFIKDDAVYGRELWKSDGTEAGTVLVKDIKPGTSNSFPNVEDNFYFEPNFTNFNDTLYFFADNGINGAELWKSDGTAEGTVLVKDINPGSGNSILPYDLYSYTYKTEITIVNDIFYFIADDGIHGAELWKSDGTTEGTVLVKDIKLGSDSSFVSIVPFVNADFNPDLTDANGRLYFIADDGIHGAELWTSDGTQAGTVLVNDLKPGPASPFLDDSRVLGFFDSKLTNVNGILYFTAGNGISGVELWALNTNPPGNSTVSITASDANAVEAGNNSASFRITRTGDRSTALAIKYTVSGNANNGSDYNQITGIASLAVGESFVDINIIPIADELTEGDETVTLTLATGNDYEIDTSEATATVAIFDQLNVIDGSGSRDPLIGTAGNDRITGGTGSKTITGGAGFDEFVYTSIREVGHRITDFTVGEDKIVLTQLLDSLVPGGYNGNDAISDGYVRLVQGSTANSTIVQIDRDGVFGSAIFRPLIELDNVTPQVANNVNNFAF